jgi:hypothetical protein
MRAKEATMRGNSSDTVGGESDGHYGGYDKCSTRMETKD